MSTSLTVYLRAYVDHRLAERVRRTGASFDTPTLPGTVVLLDEDGYDIRISHAELDRLLDDQDATLRVPTWHDGREDLLVTVARDSLLSPKNRVVFALDAIAAARREEVVASLAASFLGEPADLVGLVVSSGERADVPFDDFAARPDALAPDADLLVVSADLAPVAGPGPWDRDTPGFLTRRRSTAEAPQ